MALQTLNKPTNLHIGYDEVRLMLNLKSMQSWSATGWSQIWLKSDSNQGIPEACQKIRWTWLLSLWGDQWIFGRLSDLKQPWLDVTGEARAWSTCNWRPMHECSVGWLKNVLANSSIFFLNGLWRGWKKIQTINCVQSNYDFWSSESWVFGLELSILCS